MALHLPRTFILLHPYNGYILGIFLDVHVISLIQAQCTTALTGPQLQIILFGLLHKTTRPDAYSSLMLAPSGLRGSSATDPKTSEGYVAHYLLAVTLPSTGSRESSSSHPKTSEGGNLLCSLPMSASIFLRPVFANLRRTDRRWCPQQCCSSDNNILV